MFTGLVEAVGQVVRAEGKNPLRLTVETSLAEPDTAIGASISIDGCCLTVVARAAGTLTFEAATETLARTTLGDLRVGTRVNLEQALKVGDRLGGHLVSGHVDGMGTVRSREQRASALYFAIESPREIRQLIAPQGSVTVAGVSLTVTSVDDTLGTFSIALIPHTLAVTTLGSIDVGTRVNVEADVVARYVERLAGGYRTTPTLTAQTLMQAGFA